MYTRKPVVLALVASLAACSSSNGTMPATRAASPSLPDARTQSAVRLPASVLADVKRHRLGLSTTPYPLSALAFPLSALAFPLSALAFPLSALAFVGSPSAPTSNACPTATSKQGDISGRMGLNKKDGAPCTAQINLTLAVNPNPQAAPSDISGVQPGLLSYMYNLPDKGGNNQTIGIVVAYDNPQAEADLGVYRRAFGLHECTTDNGCFHKIAGSGNALPQPDAGWSVESSLDVDAVSAACPKCNILLVEAASDQIPALASAVDTAVTNGATVVSNSYGVAEAADNAAYASHYQHPGVPITAAAGDLKYGVQFPASVPSVTAVGGTTALQLGNGGMSEVVWPLTGSGCSAFFPKPSWQHDTGCPGRTLNDVAMISDPTEGLAVYDSTLPGYPTGGWTVIGGTSLAAPLVASMFALGGKHGMASNADIYAAAAATDRDPTLLPITSGTNGSCTPAYLCTGGAGYNGPAGNGVPWGVGAFTASR